MRTCDAGASRVCHQAEAACLGIEDLRRAREGSAVHNVIAKRRKPEDESLEEMYVAFAVSGPSFNVESLYPRRRRIGIGYKIVKQTRIRTPDLDKHVRIVCFVLSLMAHNAWTMMHSNRRALGDNQRNPRAALRVLLILEAYG